MSDFHNAKPFSSEWYEVQLQRLGPTACEQIGFYVIPDDLLLSVVIPVFNEAQTLQELVERVKAVPIRKEIILVDDCSTDATPDVLKNLLSVPNQDEENRLVVETHEKNRGKGAAVRTGFDVSNGDIVLIQDADLEYNPADFWKLLQPIVKDKADVVFGD